MTANGKITTTALTGRPGTRILITTDHLGGPSILDAGPDTRWYPATRKTGVVAATVIGSGDMRGNRRTRYEIHTDRGVVADLSGSQTFWLAPDGDPRTTRIDGTRMTVKELVATEGVRVLITRDRKYGGGGKGVWKAATNPRRTSWQTAPGELAGIEAATVMRVVDSATYRGRYDVVTDLGVVQGLTPGQPFRLAARDTAPPAAPPVTELLIATDRPGPVTDQAAAALRAVSKHLWEINHPSDGPDGHPNRFESFDQLRHRLEYCDEDLNHIYRWDWEDDAQSHRDTLFVEGQDRGGQWLRLFLVAPRRGQIWEASCPVTHEQEAEVLEWLRGPRVLGALRKLWEPLLDEATR